MPAASTISRTSGASAGEIASTSAAIRPTTLLGGNYYLELEPGGDRGPLRGDIPLALTELPVELDKVALALQPDLLIVVAYGLILPPAVLAAPRIGCLNVHASLLPRWRGAAPIQWAIVNGETETGVTIMKMDVGLDTGPILAQRSLRLTREDTAGSVFEKLSQLGADLLIETLPDYLSGKIQPVPQPEEGSTYAPMLKKEEGQLDFTRPAEELERRVRALNPWPGAFMDFDGTLLKIHRAHALPHPRPLSQPCAEDGLRASGETYAYL